MFVVLITDRSQEEGSSSENFDAKIQLNNGNFVKFSSSFDTIYKNGEDSPSKSNQLNKRNNQLGNAVKFYDLVNKDKITLQEDDKKPIWVDNKDLLCNCPKIRINKKYLLMTKSSALLKYLNIQTVKNEDLDIKDDKIQLNYDLDDEIDSVSKSSNNNNNNNNVTSSKIFESNASKISSYSFTTNAKNQFAGILIDRETFIIEWRNEFNKRLRRFLKHSQNGKCPGN